MRTMPILLALTCGSAMGLAGCGGNKPTATCEACGGSGKLWSGQPCSRCYGRGYREVESWEVQRKQHQTENWDRVARGERPLSESESWWEKHRANAVGIV